MTTTQTSVILVPVDGSAGSHKALALAAELATRMGVDLQLLYAFPADAMEILGPLGDVVSSEQLKLLNPDNFNKLRDDSAAKVFAEARANLDAAARDRTTDVLLAGDPAEAILKHARDQAQPLIIVGSRGMSRVKEMMLGSVSQRLVHRANCPVTVVH
ncbi:universal stress protein [Salinispirillum marinum]|uniref:Universal stress protein n=2 Tax=Saccharospirillaceae TaxID=255527 RepID=A0ABV8BDR4_9GAMM